MEGQKVQGREETEVSVGTTRTAFERLFVGDIRAAGQLAKVNPVRIRTVVSVCEEKIEVRGEGIAYLQISIRDTHPVPFEKIDQVINAIARNIPAGPVLIRCAGGMSRSPVMTAVYFDLGRWRTFDELLRQLSAVRTVVDPSPILMRSAREYLRIRA